MIYGFELKKENIEFIHVEDDLKVKIDFFVEMFCIFVVFIFYCFRMKNKDKKGTTFKNYPNAEISRPYLKIEPFK